jgi:hypothetical protein
VTIFALRSPAQPNIPGVTWDLPVLAHGVSTPAGGLRRRRVARSLAILSTRMLPSAQDNVVGTLVRLIRMLHEDEAGWYHLAQQHLAMPRFRGRHVAGNPTLTAYNQHYGNRGFNEKIGGRNGLRKSPHWLNKALRNVKDWGYQEINRRGRRLLRVALRLWPGPRSG